MTTRDKKPHIGNPDLRLRAEVSLGVITTSGTENEPLRLHHELQVHQVELEMQNAELRQARDELESALEQYTDLYEFAPVGYISIDRNETISRVNLTGATLMRVDRSLLIGRRFGSFVTNDARSAFTAFLSKVFTSPAKVTSEISLLGGGTPIHLRIEGLVAISGQECRLALIDLTESKLAAEVLRLAQKAGEAQRRAEEVAEALHQEQDAAEKLRVEKEIAETLALAKSQFLVNMSHELRTPMTGILGMLHLALEEDSSEIVREYLATTQRSAQSMLGILNDILDMAKFEAGKLILEEKPFSPRDCISQVIDIITPEVHRKGLNIECSVAADVPETSIGDLMRLRQVLLNLVGNAVKFTDAGKVLVTVTAGRVASDGMQEITFTVSDTGIGIPADKKGLLFRVFSQVDPSMSRNYGGTGLGLAISKEIVEKMGGTVSFISEEGLGTVFSFTLHLKESRLEHDVLPAVESKSNEWITFAHKKERIPRILLAEDDPTIRQVLGGMLKRSNYILDFAADGLQAIEMWEQGGYDLVLMDVQMPRLNGFEATSVIRDQEQKHGGHTPIVAMTAHAGKDDEKRCIDAGMDAYISKPIDFKKTLHLIRETLNRTVSTSD